MGKLSILIPSRNETYECEPGITVLQRTVWDIYEKATGDIEVIVAFDGPPYQDLPTRDNLIPLYLEQKGSKNCINEAAKVASGKYIFKVDSHCMFSGGFDEALQNPMEDNWVVTPRFYVLDAEHWKWQDERFYDYFLLPCPLTDPRMFRFQAGGHWMDRTQERLDVQPVDENMKLHGSAFMMNRLFFWECLGGLGLDQDPSSGEDIEVSLKTWMGPWSGKLMTNKTCWYAHMHKGGQRPQGWGVSWHEAHATYKRIAQYWMGNHWPEKEHDISWLIDRFYPIPGWPEDWKDLYARWLADGEKV